MSVIEQIKTHTIYSSVDSYMRTLESIENNEEFLISLSEYGIQTINRCKSVLNHLKYRLDSNDPFLLRKAVLDAIQNECTNIHSLLQSYENYLTQDAHLNTINTRLDNILANIIAIPQLVDSDAVEGIRETVISFRRAVGQNRKRMETLQELYSSKIEENTSYVDSLNTSFNQLTEQFDSKNSEFEDRLEQALTDFNNRWEKLHTDNEEVIKETINKLEQYQQSFLDESKKKQEEYDGILEEHKKSVESLVGIISTNSISGHFKEVADKKEKLTSNWQKTTLVGFLLTIAFGVYAFIFTKDLDWPSLVARFIVTTALGSFTAYAARQAAKNEVEERSNRKMEVELKTLNPYIASFSEEDQVKLKEQLFPLIFGRTDLTDKNQEQAPASQTNQLQISPQDAGNITNVIEILKGITNTNKGA